LNQFGFFYDTGSFAHINSVAIMHLFFFINKEHGSKIPNKIVLLFQVKHDKRLRKFCNRLLYFITEVHYPWQPMGSMKVLWILDLRSGCER